MIHFALILAETIVPLILCADWLVRFMATIPPHTGSLPFLRHRSSEEIHVSAYVIYGDLRIQQSKPNAISFPQRRLLRAPIQQLLSHRLAHHCKQCHILLPQFIHIISRWGHRQDARLDCDNVHYYGTTLEGKHRDKAPPPVNPTPVLPVLICYESVS